MEKYKNTRIMETKCTDVNISYWLINVGKHNTCARRNETPLTKYLKVYLVCKNGAIK